MSPNFGDKKPAGDFVPDWLLGGNRKRRVLQALADDTRGQGWTAADLSKELGCGRSTAHEVLRSLRPLEVLEERPGGRVRLARRGALATALRRLLAALAPLEDQPVDRPPRRRGAT